MRYSTLALLLFLSACSVGPPQPAIDRTVNYVALYMRRSSATETSFEQFKVSPGGVFVECGEVIRGKAVPSSQNFKPLNLADVSPIFDEATKIRTAAQKENFSLPQGSVKDGSLFDDGFLSISVGDSVDMLEVKSSMNAVADASTPQTKKVKHLATLIRRLLKTDNCGKDDFYGIPGSS